jgi:hypothetical protein
MLLCCRDDFASMQVLEFVTFSIVLEAPTHEAAVEWQHALDILLEQVVPAMRVSSLSSSSHTHSLPTAALELSEQGSRGEGHSS